MDHSGWLARVETAREELGWSGRELSRRAGLKNEAQFGVMSSRIRTKEGAQPSAMVVNAITAALAEAGFSERWLRTGTGDPRPPHQAAALAHSPPAASQQTGAQERYPEAAEARERLIQSGFDPDRISRTLGVIMFQERSRKASSLDFYWWAKEIMELEDGRPEREDVQEVEEGEF